MKNFLICGNSSKPMKLNESESTSDRYILQGLFAGPFGVENRNKRIYEVDEYLKHLQYLRDDIKKGEPLLGELDHPDDRFEVKLKEASHRVLDLWYDKASNTIQGKIELLNTPNGKLAQSLVDQGIPLHISSRAAGKVNGDKTVSIQQIYTFDLVCKPGFAGAVLHRVNESDTSNKYSKDVYKFLTESEKAESRNAAPQFGMLNEDVSITEIHSDVNLREEAKHIVENNNMQDMNNQNTKVSDEIRSVVDDAIGMVSKDFPTGAKTLESIGIVYKTSDFSINFDGQTIYVDLTYVEKIINRFGNNAAMVVEWKIIMSMIDADHEKYWYMFNDENPEAMEKLRNNVQHLINAVNNVTEAKDEDEKEGEDDNDKDDKDDEDKSDNEDKDEGVEIIGVRAETSNGDVDILSVSADDDSKDDEESDDKDKKDDDKSDEDDKDKEDSNESDDSSEFINKGTSEKKGKDPEGKEKEMLLDCDELKERKSNFEDKFADLVDAIKSKGEKKKAHESQTIQKYPLSSLLNESNFAGFMSLTESQKSNVANYLVEHGIETIDGVNESWRKGIDYKPETEVWLKYAPKEYKELFESASESVKESIRNTASFVLFENQHDVNVFWENTGLVSANGSRMLNEQFINAMPKVTAPAEPELPYGKDFINAVTEMATAYNG